MAFQYQENSQTVTTTEHSLPADATYSSGSPQTNAGTVQAFIDVANIAAGDEFRVRIYEKAGSGDTQRIAEEWFLTGAQPKPLFVTPAMMLSRGWDITIIKISGTDRSISWSVRRAPDA